MSLPIHIEVSVEPKDKLQGKFHKANVCVTVFYGITATCNSQTKKDDLEVLSKDVAVSQTKNHLATSKWRIKED